MTQRPTITDIQVDSLRAMARERLQSIEAGKRCIMCGAPFGPSVPRAKEKPDHCLECAVWLDGPYEDEEYGDD